MWFFCRRSYSVSEGGELTTGGTTATIATITDAMSAGLTTVQGEVMSMIATVVPVALVVMGAVLVISIGIKVFKKISGR